jgi:hypothetical protein
MCTGQSMQPYKTLQNRIKRACISASKIGFDKNECQAHIWKYLLRPFPSHNEKQNKKKTAKTIFWAKPREEKDIEKKF